MSFSAMEERVGQVIFTHPSAGWRVVVRRTLELFQTQQFQESPWIRGLCDQVPFMYVMESLDGGPIPDFPGGHFGTYFRCTPRRPYSNKTLEDLYWLHELTHLVTWRVGGSHAPPILNGEREDWYPWSLRMIDSELVAAVHSECMSHVVIEGLRELVFQRPMRIWVDRFLEELTHLFRTGEMSLVQLYERLAKERLAVLEGHHAFNDYVVRQIAGYYGTNLDWVVLFGNETVGFGPHAEKPAFRCVEEHLPDVGDPRKHAVWLDSVTPTKADLTRLGLTPNFQVPFGAQAHSFQDVFGKYLRTFGNGVFYK